MPCLMHDLFDLRRPFGAQDLVEVDCAEQLERWIDHKDLAEAIGEIVVLPHIVDRLANRPEWWNGDELGLHATAGRLFRIVERAAKPDPFREWQLRKDLVLILLVEIFQ